MPDWMRAQLADHAAVGLLAAGLADDIYAVAEALKAAFDSGGTLYTFGNGGSAADAQHLTGELIGHYKRDRRPLPAVTLSLFTMASLTRLSRSALLDVLGNDYIRTARAKGLRESRIVTGHALRNAALPLITVAGLELGGLLTGAVITETVFAWPGIGRLAVDGVRSRDYPVVQAAALFIAAIFVLINFCIDYSYALLDPQVRGV